MTLMPFPPNRICSELSNDHAPSFGSVVYEHNSMLMKSAMQELWKKNHWTTVFWPTPSERN
ncbi:hypothetical protein AAZX31_04G085900 [Glycine max]